jgi:SP family arabinose:H+ symporter-like MFS transporter
MTILGAWAGCLLSSRPSEYFGRKVTLLGNSFFYIIGAILSLVVNKYSLFCGRFLSGIGVGVTSVVCPIILSEVAPVAIRGFVTTMYQVNITASILVASLFAYGFVNYVNSGWRWCQGLELIPACLPLIMAPYIRESPKWLVQNNQQNEAMSVLKSMRVNNEENVLTKELLLIIEECKTDPNAKEVTWTEVFADKRPLTIGCLLMFIQAFTGINSVVFYSTTIFAIAGFKNAILATVMWGVVNLLSTIGSASLMDKYGRKIFLIIGTSIMCVSLIVLSTSLLTTTTESSASSTGTTVGGIIAVISVLFYIFGFAIGLGAVVWVMLSELMQVRTRSKAISLFLSVNWASNFTIGMTSLIAIDLLGGIHAGMTDDEELHARTHGVAYLYYIFAALSGLAVVYMYICVPETKGKKPEDFLEESDVKSPLLQQTFLHTESNTGDETYKV